MQNIKIKTSELLPIVVENRRLHDDIYKAAVEGYWQKAEKVLNEKLEKVKVKEKIESNLGLSFPITHEDDYDRVISMLKLSNEEVVTLTASEFDAYVRNQWQWKHSFLSVNSTYVTGAMYSGVAAFGNASP